MTICSELKSYHGHGRSKAVTQNLNYDRGSNTPLKRQNNTVSLSAGLTTVAVMKIHFSIRVTMSKNAGVLA